MSGLLLYMRGLAVGPMGVVAPLSAVVGAGLPLVAGVLGGERPGAAGWLALVVALVAIALASAGSRGDAAAGAGLVYGLGAGAGFGLFFVALDVTPDGLRAVAAGRRPGRLGDAAGRRAAWARRGAARCTGCALMLLCGVLDTAANVLFLLATRDGIAERERGARVALPGGRRAAGAGRAAGAADRAAAHGRRAGADGERAARGGERARS